MERHLKILLLEDSADDVDLIERELRQSGIDFSIMTVKRKEEFEKGLREFQPDIILSDHSLPQFNSIEAMKIWKDFQAAHGTAIPFILITGSVSEEFAVQSIKSGAHDYILKDRLKRLSSSIKGALEKASMERERQEFIASLLAQSTLMKEAEHLAKFGSWKVDLPGGKHEWSEEAFRIFGFFPGEIDPDYESFFRHVHPADVALLKRTVNDAITNLPAQRCEYRIVDKEGNGKTVVTKILVKRDAKGRPFQLIGFTLDITEQKKQTRALEVQNQKLMDIAWVQSHEVRAPLARLMGLVQLVEHLPKDNDELKGTLRHIMQSARELDAIVRKVVRKTEEIV